MNKKTPPSIYRYIAMATQFLVAIIVAVYFGNKLDVYGKFEEPFGIWLLPLLLIIGMIVKIIRDTSPKK
jgi:hypothetical protein